MKKSDLPIGSVVKIGHSLAVKCNDTEDEGHNWRYVHGDGVKVDYDDVYKSTWDLVSAPLNQAGLEKLVRNAMASGAVWFVENRYNIDRTKSMTEVFGDYAAEFLKYRADLIEGLQG